VFLVGLAGASVIMLGVAIRERRRSPSDRARAALAGPLSRAFRPSIFRLAVERAAVTIVAVLASEVGRRTLRRVFDVGGRRFPVPREAPQ
jgi:hypothetical protein